MTMVVARISLPETLANHLLCVGGNVACESGLGHFANVMLKDGAVQIIIRHPMLTDPEIRAAVDGAVAMTMDRIKRERQTGICGRCNGTGKFTWSDRKTPPNGVEHD